jgi:hypothetical protein
MIVVNKFELYRQYTAQIEQYDDGGPFYNTTVINNTFHYDFTVGYVSDGIIKVTNTQQLFTLNKINCFFTSIKYPTNTTVNNYLYNYVNTGEINIQVRNSTGTLVYNNFLMFLTLQVYF